MARGFESKGVADQQEAAQAAPAPRERPEGAMDPAQRARLHQLELSRADVLRRLAEARIEGYREMLRRALEALDEEIAALS